MIRPCHTLHVIARMRFARLQKYLQTLSIIIIIIIIIVTLIIINTIYIKNYVTLYQLRPPIKNSHYTGLL